MTAKATATKEAQEIGDEMARKLSRLASEFRRRGYDDADEIEGLVAAWRAETDHLCWCGSGEYSRQCHLRRDED